MEDIVEDSTVNNWNEELEIRFGFSRFKEGPERLGWLFNMRPTVIEDSETGIPRAAVDLYFIQQDGSTFKSSFPYYPYFYLGIKENYIGEVEKYLRNKFEQKIIYIEQIFKEDLELKNHLSGLKKLYLKLSFSTVQDLLEVRNELFPLIKKNKEKQKLIEIYAEYEKKDNNVFNVLDSIIDIREYDVRYYMRVSIDKDLRCGHWYNVKPKDGAVLFELKSDIVTRADPKILAFDIETTKLPLKFPDAEIDSLMMISYMLDGKGYLIVNREIVSEDIENFEYTPKPEYEGCFTVFNTPNELCLIKKFISHIQETKPNIYVTFNGDFFDWPFIDVRAKKYGISLLKEIGVKSEKEEYKCRFGCHIDVFKWVKRDSYLPQGSQGLKAVTKAKLGYSPLEVDPELMVKFANEKPQLLASYSVSDAVATYYLYMKYVHPFIFSLCTIIPMNPDDVLRKGSGTLCEALLETEAFKANIIYPNKQSDDLLKTFNGHVLESETYVGGHVEALESGVFRNDIPAKFNLDPNIFDELIQEIDKILKFAIEVEGGMKVEMISNYNIIKEKIVNKLQSIQNIPKRKEHPVIYHLDVAAMYPNIILTNRLQPSSVVNEEICAACDFNKPENNCKRKLLWTWRGDYIPAHKTEVETIKIQLESERFTNPKFKKKDNQNKENHSKTKQKKRNKKKKSLKNNNQSQTVSYYELSQYNQIQLLKERLKDYSKKVYKVSHKSETQIRNSTFCMRENPFYVDTVRAFRDRRYIYKGKLKDAQKYLEKMKEEGQSQTAIQEAMKLVILYDSLQLAHKCILNSFYGYVMRKGARWYSMEMAGCVTYTGTQIITQACNLIKKIGRPLELDTDGIWCILPASFPQNFKFESIDNKSYTFSFPCVMLNRLVAQNFTNHQYQKFDPITQTYITRSECSIFFEVDGPYKAMILPAAKEEGKKIKKRYAVFNLNNTLAELKGFEIKRRGELKLIKTFQSQIFEKFLDGSTLEQCYASAASVANHWLDILETHGKSLDDDELLELLTEQSNMSKKLEEYGSQKSCAITAAKRLAELLGNQMIRDKGLNCSYVICKTPVGSPVTERVIPVAVFSIEDTIKSKFIHKWAKDRSDNYHVDIRDILDWDYYKERLISAIQKIITIPACMQKVPNPVSRVTIPDWLDKLLKERNGLIKQKKINNIFQKINKENIIEDIENIGNIQKNNINEPLPIVRTYKRIREENGDHRPLKNSKKNNKTENKKISQEDTEYDIWLKEMKKKWKEQKEARKKRKEMFGISSKKNDSQVTRFIQKQVRNLTQSDWEIIKISETETNGEYILWVLVDNSLYPIKLYIPKIFYINFFTNDTNRKGKKVSYYLPRSKPCFHLYEYSINQVEFRKNSKTLSSLFTCPEVEGVYETKVSGLFRAILHFGCVVSLTKKLKEEPFSFNHYFELDNFQMKENNNYLNGNKLKQIFIYHSFHENVGIFGVFFISSYKAYVIVLNPYSDSQLPNVKRLIREKLSQHDYQIQYIDTNIKDAYYYIDNLILDYKAQKKGPTIITIQCSKTLYDITKSIPSLNEFPCISVPFNELDNKYPVLAWESFATQALIQRYLDISEWYKLQLEFARFSQIPIGNLENDYPIFVSDVLYARILKKNKHLLWISDTSRPDLGGSEEDDNSFVEELINPEICEPNNYKTICVELDVIGLTVNTVLEANKINEIEGTSSLLNLDINPTLDEDMLKAVNKLKSFDESFTCMKVFKILRMLITEWSCQVGNSLTNEQEVTNESSINPADILIGHFYRWISSPHSKLYDPALHRLIHNLMKKVFWQLIAEFKKLGSKIIFANFNKVILCTNKTNIHNAESYIDFILQNIKQKDLFSWIDIEPHRYWEILLFMDNANFGGIIANSQNSVNINPEKIIAHWNIGEYLPKEIQQHFLLIISDFILHTRKNILDNTKQNNNAEELINQYNENSNDTFINLNEEKFNSSNKIINTVITQRLFKIIDDIQRSLTSYNNPLSSENNIPALQFIKMVCQVLALDKSIEEDVYRLKKNLLKLIHIREFSEEAEFINPCTSYILNDVICNYCNSTRDMDLLRDTDLINEKWLCKFCGHIYDKSTIEAMLVEIIQKKTLSYQLQDLICEKCKLVKAENMNDICPNCSGNYICKMNPIDFKKSIQIFKNIAETHKFEWLKEIVFFLLQLS